VQATNNFTPSGDIPTAAPMNPLATITGSRRSGFCVVTVDRGPGRHRRYRVSLRRWAQLREWSVARTQLKVTGWWGRSSVQWYVWPLAWHRPLPPTAAR
jgi:hypothetical protein